MNSQDAPSPPLFSPQAQVAFEHLPHLVWVSDAQGCNTYLNSRWYDYTGLDRSPFSESDWRQTIHPDDVASSRLAWQRSLDETMPFRVEVRFRGRNGSYAWFLNQATPLRDAHGNVIGWLGTCTDIDGEKRALSALRESENRCRTLLDTMPAPVWVTSTEGRASFFNCRWNQYFEQASDASRELGWQATVHPGDLEKTWEAFGRASRDKGPFEIEYRLRRSDGAWRWNIGRANPLLDAQGDVTEWVGTCIDVHDQREREEALCRAQEELRNVLRQRDEFLATLSHELRTPMNVIQGWVGLLRAGDTHLKAAGSNGTQRIFETLERNCAAQIKLIDDLLDVSRIINGLMSLREAQVDLVEVVQRGLETLTLSARHKEITLSFEPYEGAFDLVGDPDRLQQVVWNLLSNAVKFTPRGGNVRLRLSHGPNCYHLIVEDTGQGIAPDFLPYVFDRFSQADHGMTRRSGGLGLGLAIVKHIVELHGGRIVVASEGEDKGTRFCVELPRHGRCAVANAAASESAVTTTLESAAALLANAVRVEGAPPHALPHESAVLEGTCILVVEDSDDTRAFLTFALEQGGARVLNASNGRQAFKLLAREPCQLVISDIGMPGMDGFEFLRRLRAGEIPASRHLPAIALTAFARSDDRAEALSAGFNAHLAKPTGARQIVSLVRALLDGRE